MIARLQALRAGDPRIGGLQVVVEIYKAVMAGGDVVVEHADVVRAYHGGKVVNVVAIKGP